MGKVIIGLGIPGAGKTTFLRDFADKNGYYYLSPDEIREELAGDSKDQSINSEIWREAHKRFVTRITDGDVVVLDASYCNASQRRAILELARKAGAEKIQGVFIDTPLEIAKERNLNRERIVPEHAIDRMYKSLSDNPPMVEDGFDSLFVLDENQELVSLEKPAQEFRIK
jgi:predicted kinase